MAPFADAIFAVRLPAVTGPTKREGAWRVLEVKLSEPAARDGLLGNLSSCLRSKKYEAFSEVALDIEWCSA